MWAERIEKQAKGLLDKKFTVQSCWALVTKEALKTKQAEKRRPAWLGE